jgi:hypothetical protein
VQGREKGGQTVFFWDSSVIWWSWKGRGLSQGVGRGSATLQDEKHHTRTKKHTRATKTHAGKKTHASNKTTCRLKNTQEKRRKILSYLCNLFPYRTSIFKTNILNIFLSVISLHVQLVLFVLLVLIMLQVLFLKNLIHKFSFSFLSLIKFAPCLSKLPIKCIFVLLRAKYHFILLILKNIDLRFQNELLSHDMQFLLVRLFNLLVKVPPHLQVLLLELIYMEEG